MRFAAKRELEACTAKRRIELPVGPRFLVYNKNIRTMADELGRGAFMNDASQGWVDAFSFGRKFTGTPKGKKKKKERPGYN